MKRTPGPMSDISGLVDVPSDRLCPMEKEQLPKTAEPQEPCNTCGNMERSLIHGLPEPIGIALSTAGLDIFVKWGARVTVRLSLCRECLHVYLGFGLFSVTNNVWDCNQSRMSIAGVRERSVLPDLRHGMNP